MFRTEDKQMTDMHLEADEKPFVMICVSVARHPSIAEMSSPSFPAFQKVESAESKISMRQ